MRMQDSKGILQDAAYYCNHIGASTKDEADFFSFSVQHPEYAMGLERYARFYAFADEDANVMRTYAVRDNVTDELTGYFSLKAGLVSLNERENPEDGTKRFDTVPGFEIANFAVNKLYTDRHPEAKGVGVVIFRNFIQRIVREEAKMIGAKVLYIFALPEDSLIERYSRVYKFARLRDSDEYSLHRRLKPAYDESCIFMYQMIR